jgi:hypothetical protein
MSVSPVSKDAMDRMLYAEINRRAQKIAEEETILAQQRVDQRIREQLADIVFKVSTEYDVDIDGQRLIISVRNQQRGFI